MCLLMRKYQLGAGPLDLHAVVAEVEAGLELGFAEEFVEDDAVEEAVDRHLASAGEIVEAVAALVDLREAHRAHVEEAVRAGEIDAGLLLVGLDLEEDDVLRRVAAEQRGAERGEVALLVEAAEERREVGGDLGEVRAKGVGLEHLPAGDGGKTLELDQLREHAALRVVAEGEVDAEKVRPRGLVRHGERGRHGAGGVGAELGRGKLARDVVRRSDERTRGVGVEEERRLGDAEVHRPIHRAVQLARERGVASVGERGVIALAEFGDHRERE